MEKIDYKALGKKIRKDIIYGFDGGKRGHIPSAFSLVEMLNVLYKKVLRYDAKNTKLIKRDRFILSKGHGCLALYAVLADNGFFDREELSRFCHFQAMLGGHPGQDKIPGVELATGSLGHGPSVGVGMAIAAKIDKRDSRIFVAVGDGECNEGTVWEAALSASQNKLGNFTLLIDYNKFQSYGPTHEVMNLGPFDEKLKSFGFNVFEADMDNPWGLEEIMTEKIDYTGNIPTAIICHTIKGKGLPMIEGNLSWHHKSRVSEEDISKIYEAIEKE